MKTFLKNIIEFLIAIIFLQIILPILVNQWDARFSRIANKQINRLLAAVESGKSSRTIEKMFSEVYSEKKNYRPLSVAVPVSASSNDVVKAAEAFIYTPYRYGGTSKRGVDCSGLTCAAYKTSGINLPRSVELQFSTGTYIPKMENLRIGDLVFFATGWTSKPSHVGLFVGDEKMIHASSKFCSVMCVNINKPYYENRFLGGRRIINIKSSQEDSTNHADKSVS